MEKYRNIIQDDANDLEKKFKNALQIIKSLFGDKAFKRLYIGNDTNPNGIWEAKKLMPHFMMF